jgi:cell division initiation protein
MKLTPLDIHHKEFRRSIRGYDDKEVDDFLDAVADEFERLFKENIDLSERMEAANEKVRTYQQMETTLHNTLVAAQRSAEEIVASAREEAASLLRDAELKAKEVIHDALTQKQKTTGELVRIKQAEEEFRARFKKTLEEYQASIREVPLPDDVNVLVGKTEEGMVADVEVATESALAALEQAGAAAEAAAVTPPSDFLIPVETTPPAEPEKPVAPVPESVIEPVVEAPPAPAPLVEPAEAELIADAWATQAMPPTDEPPASGFVTGLTLGETTPPDLPDDLELEIPPEFTAGTFDALGEREDDIDIEEID